MIKYMSSDTGRTLAAYRRQTQRIGMPHLASRVFNAPLMIHPKKLDAILHVIGPRLGITSFRASEEAITDEAYDFMHPHKRDGGGEDGANGPVVMIPVYGTLVKRGGYVGESGMTSYDAVTEMTNAAMQDTNVKALLFDIDSPGGEAAGLFDFCQYLTSLRGSKPMIGISNDMAFSAAYALASCMDKLFVTGIGGVGSIGVYMLHVDQSKADAQKGVEYTYIYSGDKKVDMNPHEPLSKSALAEAQAEVDRIRDMFVQLVAANRNVDAKKISDTEAGTFMGDLAVPMLADGVATFDEAVAFAVASGAQKRTFTITREMSEDDPTNGKHITGFINNATYTMVDGTDAWRARSLQSLVKKAKEQQVFAAEMLHGIAKGIVVMRAFGTLHMSTQKDASDVGVIRGLLAPYNSMSCNLGGFYETYQPGCFKRFLESDDDALVLAYHNPEHVLGRRSAGTARFWEDKDGLWYEADLPDTQVARDLKTSVERGDVKGSSAAFYITQHRWEQRSGGRVRIVEEASLVEGSPHSFVAYSETSAVTSEEQMSAHQELLGYKARLLKLKQQGAQYTK